MAERKHTDEELKEIAKDLYAGRIFSDRQCTTPEEVRRSFPILEFMTEEQLKEYAEREPAFIYEYLKEAAPVGINGRPMFFSCRTLNQADFDVMLGYYEKLKAAVDSL